MATTVPTGSLISPGGDQGPAGAQGSTALANTTAAGLLTQVSGNTTDFVDGTNNCQDLDSGIARVISQRSRGLNVIGNPTFEIDNRTAFAGSANGFACDRWRISTTGPTATAKSNTTMVTLPNGFGVSTNFMRITLTAQKTSLAASDQIVFYQTIEGIHSREVYNGHSLSVLVRCSSPLKFGLTLRNTAGSPNYSLVNLCTIPAANTWVLIPLPNLPIFTGAGSLNFGPGAYGYEILFGLAIGSTLVTTANGIWVGMNAYGAIGQDNFAALAVNSTFDIAYAQHEPGSIVTPPNSLTYEANLLSCLRYFCKSYSAQTAPGAVTGAVGAIGMVTQGSTHPWTPVRFHLPMAKVPTITLYSSQSGTANAVYDSTAPTDRGVSSINGPGASGYIGATLASVNTAIAAYYWHYVADTGW